MAGATNRALKAAGLPKATQNTIRVARGAGLTVQSAIQHAQAHGLPLGKAAKHAQPLTGWDKAAAGVTPPPSRPAAAVDRRAALHAAMAARRGVAARSLGIVGREALALRRDIATREAPLDRRTPPGARLNNNDYAARGGRFLERKHGLSRKESEALVLHPNTSEIQAYHHDKVRSMRVDVQSPLAHGLLRDLVSGKEKLPAKYQAMAEARKKDKSAAGERWAAIRKARGA